MNKVLIIGGASFDAVHFFGQTQHSPGGAGLYTALAAHRWLWCRSWHICASPIPYASHRAALATGKPLRAGYGGFGVLAAALGGRGAGE